jgi:RNA-directed DNA polymerase
LHGFTREDDARRVLDVLPKRFGKYGLTLHPEKTRLVPFRRPPYASSPKGGPGGDRPGTFDLLGFTHFWARSRKGNWVVKRKTAASRFSRAVRTIAHWCCTYRHRPIREQYARLSEKLKGHYAYYGITGNSSALGEFRDAVKHAWGTWLRRRRRKNRPPWSWFSRLLQRYRLPPAVAVHSVCRERSKRLT